MSKTIKSLSGDFEAFKVPTKEIVEYDAFWLTPGKSLEITLEQANSEDVKKHEAAGRVTVSAGSDEEHRVVENVSTYIAYFAVPGRTYEFSRQFVIPPNGEVTLTDEQAASPSVREFLESGKADDPDDDLVVKGAKGMYEKVAKAISAGEESVKLMGDLVEQVTVPSGRKLVIDLGGFELKSGTTTTGVIENRGELEVKDSVGGGSIVATKNFGVISGTGSKLHMAAGNYTVEAVEGGVITGRSNGAEIVIDGGVYRVSDNGCVMGNGSKGFGGNVITINGGEFYGRIKSSGYIACGIYAPTSDTFTVNGGKFDIEGGCGICARAGKVTVNGGEFKTTGDVTGKVGDSRVVVPCSALVFDTDANYPALTDEDGIFVEGGSFKSDVPCVANVGEERVFVEGGEFDPAL